MDPDVAQFLARGAYRPAGDLDEVELRRRGRRLRRRRQLTGGVAVVVLLLSVPAGVVSARLWWPGQPTTGWSAVTAGSPTLGTTHPDDPRVPTGQTPGALVPRTSSREGGMVVVSVTFLDGTTAEVVYPAALDIAGLGVRPGGWGSLVGSEFDGCCLRDFSAWKDTLPGEVRGGQLIRQVGVVDGQPVTLWSGARGDPGRYLVFTFGSWRLAVWDDAGGARMTDEQLLLWAEHLHGRTTPDGFLVLEATGPLRLAGVGAPTQPPGLGFGEVDRRQLELTPVTWCGDGLNEVKPAGRGQWTADVCRPGQPMRSQAAGDEAFVDGIVNHLRIRDVRLAPHRDGWALPRSSRRGGGTRP
jgi:hypothetical protein